MKDKKKLNGFDEASQKADKVAVNEDNFANAVDKSQDYGNSALDKELEKLADTFREELKKAQAMSEEELIKNGIIIQQYEDDEGIIPEEELCQCCGEQRRDKSFGENYEYCRKCRDAMRKYPLSISGIITLAAVVFVAVVSVFSFAADYDMYDTVRKGDSFLNENKLYSALETYDQALAAFEEADVNAKKLYLKTAKILYHTMPEGVYSMSDISARIEAGLSDFERSLPIYYSYEEMRQEVQTLYGTINQFYTLLNDEKYADYDVEDKEQYEEIMTAIGSIIDQQITVTLSDNTSTLVNANEAAVRFCQYMFAYSAEKYDDSYQYMKMVYELEPSYLWLYAYELGIVELQKGNLEEAQYFADALCKSNAELAEGYVLQSAIKRMTGSPKSAIEWAEKGIEAIPNNAELYRMKAMACIVEGDLESAKKMTDKALEIEEYALLYFVDIVVESELENDKEVEVSKSALEELGVEYTEKMEKYMKGKISAVEMFTEGTGDVE